MSLNSTETSRGVASFRETLLSAASHLARADAEMATTVQGTLHGRGLDQADLLMLQARVYRYGQEMELASRLVDRATQAVKQTLQSQT